MNTPYFSIVMPTYNRSSKISKSIDSVLSQSFQNFEIIIVNDASTDDTLSFLINHYARQVKVISLESNGGPNIARNKGVLEASGEWIIFLDSDDTLTENALAELHKLTQTIDTSALYAACINSDGHITSNHPSWEDYLSYQEYLCGKIKGEYLPVIKKETVLRIPFDESTRRAPGIGHVRIAKVLGKVYMTSFVARNYDTTGSDRICAQKKDFISLSKVWRIIISDQWRDRLRFCPCKLAEALSKYLYYTIRSFVK